MTRFADDLHQARQRQLYHSIVSKFLPAHLAQQFHRLAGVTEHVLDADPVIMLAHTAPAPSPVPHPGNAD